MAYKPADLGGGERLTLDTGDSSAGLGDIYQQEKPRLLGYFYRKTGNRADADDMVQETMARFLKIAPITAIATPRAYLTRIATNLLRDHGQRGSTLLTSLSRPLDESIASAPTDNPHRNLEARQDLERWKQILQRLPPRTLEIFVLNRVEGKSYREISESLSLPLWVIQKHMLKAIRHVAAHRDAIDD